MIDYSNDSFRW